MKRYLFLAILIFSLVMPGHPVSAASAVMPGHPVSADGGTESVWGEVFDDQGNLKPDLKDLGVKTEEASWMPHISVFGKSVSIKAEYHEYLTPSGNIVVVPNAATQFFMALNPHESGMSGSILANGAGMVIQSVASIIRGAGVDVSKYGYVTADQFADALISGKTDFWSIGFGDVARINRFLGKKSFKDRNLYFAVYLLTPDQCFETPGGCPEDALPPAPPPPPPSICPADEITPGRILLGGELLYPPYPLVVGQDPARTGVDVSFSVTVEPTVKTWYVPTPVKTCAPITQAGTVSDCTQPNGLPGVQQIVSWECERHQQTYQETIIGVYGRLDLSADSRDWILNTLSIRYPGAYLHHPTFTFPAFRPNSSTWTYTAKHVQTADPGTWNIVIIGQTSGTPVSPPRPINGVGGTFKVWLKETTIIR